MIAEELLMKPIPLGGVDEQTMEKYLVALATHIMYVQEAGRMLGVSEDQLAVHDASKYDAQELAAYARHHYGDQSDPEGYAIAWLHHLHCNPHHWQHWLFPAGHSTSSDRIENGVVEMPQHYALEMVADWMGASMAYQGTWDMLAWLAGNVSGIILHSRTAAYVKGVLISQGYADVFDEVDFARSL